jgi:hypothetical protein
MAEDTDSLKDSLKRAYFDSACGEQEPPGDEGGPQCTGLRVNQYHVESPTNRPFYGIKYEFQSGTEIKHGLWDEYKLTLTQAEAEALSSVRIQAKAGRNFASSMLWNCDFAGTEVCGPVGSANVKFSFQGAQDNGDGTLTLTFRVENGRRYAISHVLIGLPDGVTPSTPTDKYQSEVCP